MNEARHGFQVTAVYVSGFRKGLVELGLLQQVSERVKPSTREVLEKPFSSSLHDGDVLADLSDTLHTLAGSEVVQKHAYLMARDSLGKILVPMFKVALALTGRTPASLLARVPDSVHQAIQGVRVKWLPSSAEEGVLRVEYPTPVTVVAAEGWRGTLKFLFELLDGASARIVRIDARDEQRTLEIRIRW
jgi:hypothetical protein